MCSLAADRPFEFAAATIHLSLNLDVSGFIVNETQCCPA
jgi:hypothetical protein